MKNEKERSKELVVIKREYEMEISTRKLYNNGGIWG